MIILVALFWFILALLLAMVEIEIEGKFGWAEKLPTWYRKSGCFKSISYIWSKKPQTGYHLFMISFLVLIFHAGFFLGLNWNLEKELEILSIFFIFIVIWDFLWFVLNLAYTIKNFKKSKIWWYSTSYWVLGLFPIDYLYSLVISLILAYFAGILVYQLELIGLFILFTFIAIVVAPYYHKWYKKMRKKDDRKLSGIFH